MAYKRLMEEFHLKQDEIADRVAKSRTAVTNSMRLLKLTSKVQEMVIADMISAGHARALLGISDETLQENTAMKVFDERKTTKVKLKLNIIPGMNWRGSLICSNLSDRRQNERNF